MDSSNSSGKDILNPNARLETPGRSTSSTSETIEDGVTEKPYSSDTDTTDVETKKATMIPHQSLSVMPDAPQSSDEGKRYELQDKPSNALRACEPTMVPTSETAAFRESQGRVDTLVGGTLNACEASNDDVADQEKPPGLDTETTGDEAKTANRTEILKGPSDGVKARGSMTSGEDAKEDVFIAVMGATGAGKSSLIRSLTDAEVTVGHRLSSCTTTTSEYICEHPDWPGKRVVLIDTPGFQDSWRGDLDILEETAKYFAQSYKEGKRLTGILYLTRISDNRMTGVALKNLEMFRDFCGEQALLNVILVTTMWDTVKEPEGTRREADLEQQYWKELIRGGAQSARFDRTTQGARSIIGRLKGKPETFLEIQRELVDYRLPLGSTQAGSALGRVISALEDKHKDDLATIDKEYERAQRKNNRRMMEIMAARRREALQNEIDFKRAWERLENSLGGVTRGLNWVCGRLGKAIASIRIPGMDRQPNENEAHWSAMAPNWQRTPVESYSMLPLTSGGSYVFPDLVYHPFNPFP